jgi:hypothetical protein
LENVDAVTAAQGAGNLLIDVATDEKTVCSCHYDTFIAVVANNPYSLDP